MIDNSGAVVCLACLNLDGTVSTEIAETLIVQPPPRNNFPGSVCKRCLSLNRVTRVTCRTFRPVPPDAM